MVRSDNTVRSSKIPCLCGDVDGSAADECKAKGAEKLSGHCKAEFGGAEHVVRRFQKAWHDGCLLPDLRMKLLSYLQAYALTALHRMCGVGHALQQHDGACSDATGVTVRSAAV